MMHTNMHTHVHANIHTDMLVCFSVLHQEKKILKEHLDKLIKMRMSDLLAPFQ